MGYFVIFELRIEYAYMHVCISLLVLYHIGLVASREKILVGSVVWLVISSEIMKCQLATAEKVIHYTRSNGTKSYVMYITVKSLI